MVCPAVRTRAPTKKSETVPVPERVTIVMNMMVKAAERGEPAPNNSLIAAAIGASSGATAAAVVSLLETMGLVTVVRGKLKRVVTIVATGKKTAGTVEDPIDYGQDRDPKPVKRRPFWNVNRTATLMQRIADGADFEQAAILCDCTGEEAEARFDELAAQYGEQAA